VTAFHMRILCNFDRTKISVVGTIDRPENTISILLKRDFWPVFSINRRA